MSKMRNHLQIISTSICVAIVVFCRFVPLEANCSTNNYTLVNGEELETSLNRSTFANPDILLRQLIADQCGIYTKGSLPVRQQNETVKLSMGMTPLTFKGIQDREQTFSVISVLRMYWPNPCTRWDNIEEWANVFYFLEPVENVWSPSLQMMNGVNEILIPKLIEGYEAAFYNNGFVYLSAISEFTTSCELHLTKFPYDQQTCTIEIEPKMTSRYMSISLDKALLLPPAETFVNKANIWEFVSFNATVKEILYPGDKKPYHRVVFSFTFKRRYEFYVMPIFLPTFCLIILQLSASVLPPDEIDRANFCITIVLSYAVLMTMITDVTPLSSDMPYIVLILGYHMGTSVFCTLYCMVTCGLARRSRFKKKLVKWSKIRLSLIRTIDIVFYGVLTLVSIVIDFILISSMLS